MRVREGLIVTQVALALVLLSGAALLGRSLYSVVSVDPGYSLDDGLIVALTVPGDGSPAAMARQASQSPALSALANRGEPVMLVRSPMTRNWEAALGTELLT